MSRCVVRILALVLALVGTGERPTSAQTIPIRTVPVASGDQFLLLSSTTLGMGGVRVAVDDTLADPWVNPAKGALVGESAFLGSPTLYSISSRGGAGRSFPLAGVYTGDAWFGGAAFALQQIENEGPEDVWVGTQQVIDFWEPPSRLSDRSNRNLYGAAYVGRRLTGGWSVGLGLSAAQLDAMDGVDLLYARADRIEQSGSSQDFKVGVRREGDSDRLSLLVLHSRLSMTHDVRYEEWIWDPVLMNSVLDVRVEQNQDESRTWGAHLEWDRDLGAPGWRVGASATLNRKSHPKIPDYEIQNIPRDPGITWAYEAAFGLARVRGATTLAVDVALQPIWSETWQEANGQDVVDSGGRLRIGDRSIENDFFFTNVILRAGVAHTVGMATLQAGLEVRSYDYSLEQANHVLQQNRDQDESWIEWTPTLGVLLAFTDVDVRYGLRHTTGTGRPGTDWVPVEGTFTSLSNGRGDFIIAPEGPLTLQDATVLTHQLSVRIPVR